ncbi:unnamed protein product [Porites lobata]|uniref:Kazal-like domain-containing protein n=1 Tax=Porites lobata TaxID=104759 RepID=A0ABN8NNI6_9CNID|nr:unnamed protein product [Porites lobata]
MEICTKNYHSDESMMSILAIDYLVIGDLDPCINVTCGYYRYCKALAPHVVRCVCADICPSYKEPVCSSNGTTYDNKCLFEQETSELYDTASRQL